MKTPQETVAGVLAVVGRVDEHDCEAGDPRLTQMSIELRKKTWSRPTIHVLSGYDALN